MPVFWTSPTLYQAVGRPVAISWEAFAARAQNPKHAICKDSLARWSPCEYRGERRCIAGITRAHGVVLDVDDGSELAKIAGALEGLHVIAHSTFSATPKHPRWRVIVPLEWPVDADGYGRVWRWLAVKFEAVGVTPDYGARDAAHAWAVPAVPPNGHYICLTIEAPYARADDAFAAVPKPEPLPEPTREERTNDYGRTLKRAAAYLATMPGGIQGSGGSTTTMRAAIAMVRGFGLQPDDALRLLVEVHNPLCAPAWSERELIHKVRQAVQRSGAASG